MGGGESRRIRWKEDSQPGGNHFAEGTSLGLQESHGLILKGVGTAPVFLAIPWILGHPFIHQEKSLLTSIMLFNKASSVDQMYPLGKPLLE